MTVEHYPRATRNNVINDGDMNVMVTCHLLLYFFKRVIIKLLNFTAEFPCPVGVECSRKPRGKVAG
jgi:hypothetical protein